MPHPEALAREEIDEQLGRAGWLVQDYADMNITARPEIQSPALLRKLIVDLIDQERWTSMDADVKGDIYEGLLAKSASESPKGAGQYFTPRELIKGIVDAVQPRPEDTLCDSACGTGGFLLSAYDYVIENYGSELDPDQKEHLRTKFATGVDIVPATARLGLMNLYQHGINPETPPIRSGLDSLASDPGERYSLVLTNPPLGKKSSITIVNDEGEAQKEDRWSYTTSVLFHAPDDFDPAETGLVYVSSDPSSAGFTRTDGKVPARYAR